MGQINKLQKWQAEQWRKRIRELKNSGIEICIDSVGDIVEEMSFKNRSQKAPYDCPCYLSGKPCHDIADLNCFVCACPNYFSDRTEGGCKIGSKLGEWYEHANLPAGRIWDCSGCGYGHAPDFVERFIKRNIRVLRKMSENLRVGDRKFLSYIYELD